LQQYNHLKVTVKKNVFNVAVRAVDAIYTGVLRPRVALISNTQFIAKF
jgi:hypothetical protein